MLRLGVVIHLPLSPWATMHSIAFGSFYFFFFLQKHTDTQGTQQQHLITVAFHVVRLYQTTSLWQKMHFLLLPFAYFTLPEKVDVVRTVS